MMKYTVPTSTLYRHYNLPILFPYMTFFGDHWILDDAPAYPRHFHNCIELGYCKSGSRLHFIENSVFPFIQATMPLSRRILPIHYKHLPERKAVGNTPISTLFYFSECAAGIYVQSLQITFGIISEEGRGNPFPHETNFIELHQKESTIQDF